MLYTLFEFSFNGFNVFNLDLINILAIISGILVIITKNPILSVLFLILLFGSISGHLILSGLNFIGLSYLLVYIGAVSILFLFILMLINVRISELLTDSINSIPLAILIGIFFIFFVDDSSFMKIIKSLFNVKNELKTTTSNL
jgi:NADH-ubiquinone oxidoreductase chain 6